MLLNARHLPRSLDPVEAARLQDAILIYRADWHDLDRPTDRVDHQFQSVYLILWLGEVDFVSEGYMINFHSQLPVVFRVSCYQFTSNFTLLLEARCYRERKVKVRMAMATLHRDKTLEMNIYKRAYQASVYGEQ